MHTAVTQALVFKWEAHAAQTETDRQTGKTHNVANNNWLKSSEKP